MHQKKGLVESSPESCIWVSKVPAARLSALFLSASILSTCVQRIACTSNNIHVRVLATNATHEGGRNVTRNLSPCALKWVYLDMHTQCLQKRCSPIGQFGWFCQQHAVVWEKEQTMVSNKNTAKLERLKSVPHVTAHYVGSSELRSSNYYISANVRGLWILNKQPVTSVGPHIKPRHAYARHHPSLVLNTKSVLKYIMRIIIGLLRTAIANETWMSRW